MSAIIIITVIIISVIFAAIGIGCALCSQDEDGEE